MRRLPLVIAAALVVASLVPGRAEARTWDVAIYDNGYNPPTIRIVSGDTVRWTNTGYNSHTVTSDSGDPRFGNSDVIPPGGSHSWTFTSPSADLTLRYHCQIHPYMAGTVQVSHAASPTPTASATPSPTVTPTPTPGPSGEPTPSPSPTPTSTAPPPSPTPPGGGVPSPPSDPCAPPRGDALAVGNLYVWTDGLWEETNGRAGLQRAEYRCTTGVLVPADRRVP